MEEINQMSSSKRLLVGSSELNFKRDAMEIQPLYQENGISKSSLFSIFLVNFDYLEDILNKSLIDQLMINPKETPLLFTESALHNKDARIKLTEFMFEKY